MVIILLRHAKALQPVGGMTDFDRPLRPKGIKQCAALADASHYILHHTDGVSPRIWCSPSLRTRQTLLHGLPWTGSADLGHPSQDLIQYPDWLYLAESPRLGSELLLICDDMPLWVIGHNNGLSDWAYELTGGKAGPLGTCHLIILRKENLADPGPYKMIFRWEPPKLME